MVQVKICGIRSEIAAKTAVYSGAKFLGFSFVPGSKRKVTPQIAKQIIDQVKNQVKIVGVFENQPLDDVKKTAEFLDLDYVQLCGDEDENYLKELERPVIKVLRLATDFDITDTLKEMNKFSADYFLLEKQKQVKGKMLNLKHLSIMAKEKKIFVSGGLTPENVSEVVRVVKPFGVDVSGGIETERVEDTEKIKLFCEKIKSAGV